MTETIIMDGMTSGIVASVGSPMRQDMLVAFDDCGTQMASLTRWLSGRRRQESIRQGITEDPARQVIVETLIMIATLDLRSIAKGIETEAQALEQMDCRLGQGHLFGMPANVDDADAIPMTHAQPKKDVGPGVPSPGN